MNLAVYCGKKVKDKSFIYAGLDTVSSVIQVTSVCLMGESESISHVISWSNKRDMIVDFYPVNYNGYSPENAVGIINNKCQFAIVFVMNKSKDDSNLDMFIDTFWIESKSIFVCKFPTDITRIKRYVTNNYT